MKIAEISSPDLRQSHQADPQSNVLSRIELLIVEIEHHPPKNPLPDNLSADLRLGLVQLTPFAPFHNSVMLQIWKLSYRLWNACVDLSNAGGIIKDTVREEHAKLRLVSADLLFLAVDVTGIPSPAFKCASFFYKTGLIWHEIRKYDVANTCFERATDLTSKIQIAAVIDRDERKLLLDVNIARSRTAWEVGDRNLAINLLNRSRAVLFGIAENYKVLASEYLNFGKIILAKNEISGANEALKLMNEALDLCEKGLRAVKKQEETLDLKELRLKTLRFVAASHLQRDEFESVLKCVRVLRDGGGPAEQQHPSLNVLAMKAWLGLGRFEEAEKELRGMVVNKGIPEEVWVSAVESYFQAVGAAGAETTKAVFLGLLGRCHVSAGAAIRMVQRLVAGGEGGMVRAKVAAGLVSDDRVISLFAGDTVAKDRTAMHSLLWNCAADHFRSKDYEISAEMFEKSMLYIPHDVENRTLRAKGFRVLCLCHLGLSQLDRAQEYIDEAAKLDPNIASAFLKFKICLQNNDHNGATAQVKAMLACFDFTTDYLSLSAHEAIACRALPVAIDSLSCLLNYYSAGKQMPTTEVIVFRTLITILTQDPGNESEVLKYMKRAHARVSELGSDRFFGTGEVGRRERNWFSLNIWNTGLKSGKENNYELCADLFVLAAEYYGVTFDEETEGNNVMVCKSLILAVSAMLAGENKRKATLLHTEVKHAIELLDRAGKILKTSSLSSHPDDNQVSTIDPHFYFIYTLCAYDLESRLNDTESKQLALIKSYASSKACNPSYLLQIGLNASQGPRSNLEVATYSLNTCLSGLLSSPAPDYRSVALILRKIISINTVHKGDSDDDSVHGMYKQAYRIMVGLKEREYPVEEGKWLAMTAWNRAAVPVRLWHTGEAKKWMDMGLELARRVPGMETYRSCMEDFLAAFEKKIHSRDTN